MKRRGFLRGIIGGTASVVLPIPLNALERPVVNSEGVKLIDNGQYGLQEITLHGDEFKVRVLTKENDLLNDFKIVEKETFVFNWTTCEPEDACPYIAKVAMVYETSVVHIETRNHGVISFTPEWDFEKSKFKPVLFTTNIVSGGFG